MKDNNKENKSSAGALNLSYLLALFAICSF